MHELKKYKQWLLSVDKKPFYPILDGNGECIDVVSNDWSNPLYWMDYEDVKYIGDACGIGSSFVLSKDDPFVIIDLDKVLDKPRDLESWKDRDKSCLYDLVMELRKVTYCEFSRSGFGLHIIAKGKINKSQYITPPVEIYKSNKQVVLTEDLVPGSCWDVTDQQDYINTFFENGYIKDGGSNITVHDIMNEYYASVYVNPTKRYMNWLKYVDAMKHFGEGHRDVTFRNFVWKLNQEGVGKKHALNLSEHLYNKKCDQNGFDFSVVVGMINRLSWKEE